MTVIIDILKRKPDLVVASKGDHIRLFSGITVKKNEITFFNEEVRHV